MTDQSSPPPGSLPAASWYADPLGHDDLRYWDGSAWTDHVAPSPTPAPVTSRRGSLGFSLDEIRLPLALSGAAFAVFGMLLPLYESSVSVDLGVVVLKDNTMLSSGGFGLLIVPIAILGAWRAYEARDQPGRAAGVLGCSIAMLVILVRQVAANELVFNGRVYEADPGIGVFVMAAGAVILLIAGLIHR